MPRIEASVAADDAGRGDVAVVVLLTLAAFARVAGNDFVDFDDPSNLIANPWIRGLDGRHLWWMLTAFHQGHWHPLTWLTFAVDDAVWGLTPGAVHLVSVAWHVLDAALVWELARRLLARAGVAPPVRRAAAVFAACLWAVHPLRVESVAWATERRDVVSAAFILAALLAYVPANGGPPRIARAAGWMAVSLLAKASGMVLPAVLLVLDVYPLRRLGGPLGWRSPAARAVVLEKAPFVMLTLIAAALALAAQRDAGALQSLTAVPATARVGAAAYQLVFYLWKTAIPTGLYLVYEYPLGFDLAHPRALGALVACGLGVTVALACRRRQPAVTAALAVYAIVLSPTLGGAQSGGQMAADRYSYLASIAPTLLLATALFAGARDVGFRSLLLAPLPVLLATATAVQVGVWRNAGTLWSHAERLDPGNTFVRYRLADLRHRAGDDDTALRYYDEVVRARPAFAEAQSDYAAVLAARGRLDDALAHYRAAIQANPRFAFAYTSMGMALSAAGRHDEALTAHRQALAIDPTLMEAHGNLGTTLESLGRPDEALASYQAALALRPSAEVLSNAGFLLAARQRCPDAIPYFRSALQLRADLGVIHEQLADCLLVTGDRNGARQAARDALRIDPGSARARALLERAGS